MRLEKAANRRIGGGSAALTFAKPDAFGRIHERVRSSVAMAVSRHARDRA